MLTYFSIVVTVTKEHILVMLALTELKLT
jgi:hypothetical protein